ncbi:MAG: ATPase, T2SS/T4P/T4SS family [Planctomycetota bacterium]|nr:ATPase, T2SS/T4P/T4SS family [Planctomycetota bacterium]
MEAGELLLKRGLLDEAGLKKTRDAQMNGDNLMHTVVRLGLVDEEQALRVIGEEIGLQYVDLAESEPDLSLLKTFPQRLIHRETLFPLRQRNGCLLVATCDPFHLYPLDEVSAATGLTVEPVLAGRAEINKLIKSHLGVGSETVDDLLEQSDIELLDAIEQDDSELSQMAQEASVVRLVNEILLEAIESRASDVHIESHESGLTVRYRIDGMLQAQPVPAEINRFHAAIISRLKIMSRLNIAEKRLPQDGRMKLKVSGREVDVRVSVIPMMHGEGIVMRVLDKGAMEFELRSLGMSEAIYAQIRDLIQLPHGIVLVTGPTGSGKTTTLYSSLLEIRSESIKIITTEDPVEYQLEGINQIQVQPKIGLTFGSSLRSILRHDPDVVLVGEIRDLETAENAIQASLTGHLVFSTLHTNDAASAFARLVDMGAESFLVASTVEAVMAQRLVRTLCPDCKEEFRPSAADLPTDFPRDQLQGGGIFRSSGCRRCRQSGYMGRNGIFELLVANDRIRQLAHDRASIWEIMKAAVQDGLTTLRQDGWDKVLRGVTTVDEILRVTKGDKQFD